MGTRHGSAARGGRAKGVQLCAMPVEFYEWQYGLGAKASHTHLDLRSRRIASSVVRQCPPVLPRNLDYTLLFLLQVHVCLFLIPHSALPLSTGVLALLRRLRAVACMLPVLIVQQSASSEQILRE